MATSDPHAGKRELIFGYFNHVEAQVVLATNKATVLITANALLLAGYTWMVKEAPLPRPTGRAGWLFDSTSWLIPAFLFAGVLAAVWAIVPNLLDRSAPKGKNENWVFFVSVATMDRQKYVNAVVNQPTDEWLRHVAQQIHAKSVWLCRIFRHLRLSAFAFVLSVVCCAAAVVLSRL